MHLFLDVRSFYQDGVWRSEFIFSLFLGTFVSIVGSETSPSLIHRAGLLSHSEKECFNLITHDGDVPSRPEHGPSVWSRSSGWVDSPQGSQLQLQSVGSRWRLRLLFLPRAELRILCSQGQSFQLCIDMLTPEGDISCLCVSRQRLNLLEALRCTWEDGLPAAPQTCRSLLSFLCLSFTDSRMPLKIMSSSLSRLKVSFSTNMI